MANKMHGPKKSVLQQLVDAGLTHDQIEGLGKYKRQQDDTKGREGMLTAGMRGAAGRKINGGHSKYKTTSDADNSAKVLGDVFSPHNPSGVTGLAMRGGKNLGKIVGDSLKSRKPKKNDDWKNYDSRGHRIK